MFLGIDCSTQSLKLQIINQSRETIKEKIVNYDNDLKHYNTIDGVIRHQLNGFDHISTPTLLFVEALELGIQSLKDDNFDLSQILAVSGSGQQHGSVYWKTGSLKTLSNLNNHEFLTKNSDKKLQNILNDSFSLKLSPIWMDSSTTIECDELTETAGSAQNLADITGSRAYERFTGPQIKHLIKHQPDIYNHTERISLISSFLPSLFIADYAPIDLSDGSGMNLLDIHSFKWNEKLLDSIATDLNEKLGNPVSSDTKVGLISKYWCLKYGFSPKCEIYAFSGDNPCSLIGLNLNKPGDVAISLGTSDVLFAVTNQPKPNANEGSILIHPESTSQYMMMLVYKNGSMTRNHIKYSNFKEDSNWSKFNEAIQSTPVGTNEKISFYFREKEITPNLFNTGYVKFDKNDNLIQEDINETDCRGIIESQALSYKLHSKLLGLNEISSIIVTGGGSVNKQLLQIIADVFECDVRPSSLANSAANGAAIRALNAYSKLNGIQEKFQANCISDDIVRPISKHFPIYRSLFKRFEKLEQKAIQVLDQKLQ